ncbi:MAG TPA: glycosyltransferase [Candidatus Saccharimonadales bacterium]|nr:glycosyltransferase [Candidatus Saccharimonadales bacterium]
MANKPPKIAIVAEFLTVMGGAERVVYELHKAFPNAPIYTAIYDEERVLPEFKKLDVRTTWLQKFPKKLRKMYKLFPTLQVKAFRDLDLSEFDIIITSSYLNANQVRKTRSGQVLISYCHTPARYYWSHYDEYRKRPGYGKLDPIIRLLIPLLVPHQRKLDYQAAQNVDVFIANSTETQKRIKRYYGKPATVIHPPVDVDRFEPSRTRGDYYMTMGRQLPYKRYDLVVAACTKLGVPLKVFGNGPAHEQLVNIAGPNVSFYTDRFGDASDAELEKALNSAKGWIYAAEEDFGIVQVEALAAGAPVITYGRAGALDIVQDGESGVLFHEQTVEAVAGAIKKAENLTFLPGTLRRKAKRFDKSLFTTKIRKVVLDNAPSSK